MLHRLRHLVVDFGLWLVLTFTEPVQAVTPVRDYEDEAAVEEAVYRAFQAVGLNRESYRPNFDLLCTGQLANVIHLAAAQLHRDHQLGTVDGVVALLHKVVK